MKKVIIIVVAALVLIGATVAVTLVIVNSTKNNSNTTDAGQTTKNSDPSGDLPFTREDGTPSATATPTQGGNVDFYSLLQGGLTGTNWTQLDAASKQQLINSAKQAGYDVSFAADGTMTMKGEGTNMVQHPDGTWEMLDDDGSSMQLGGKWPNNKFTQLLPTPSFEIMATNSDADSFNVVFNGTIDLTALKEYVGQVKLKGFTLNIEEDLNEEGYVTYEFKADNGSYAVDIYYGNGTVTLGIELLEG